MKILFVSATEYAVEHFAGPYIVALNAAGHEIEVLTGGDKQLISLSRHIRKNKFDVVYSISPKGGLITQMAAKLAGTKIRVHFVTGQTWKTRSGLGRLGLKWLDKLMCSLTTKAYVDSQSQVDYLVDQKVLNPAKAVVLASGSVSGVVVEDFLFSEKHRVDVRQQYGIKDDEVLVFFLGRISTVKGIRDLVNAFAIAHKQDKKLRLLIVGPDDGDQQAIQQIIDENDLNSFVSADWALTPRPAIQYSAAEMLCVPSYMEGFGNVVLEAACAGVPTVGSDIYGLQDSIADGHSGLRYELGNVQALADCLLKLASDETLRKTLGRNALERAKNEFAQSILVDAFMAAHQELTGEAKS